MDSEGETVLLYLLASYKNVSLALSLHRGNRAETWKEIESSPYDII